MAGIIEDGDCYSSSVPCPEAVGTKTKEEHEQYIIDNNLCLIGIINNVAHNGCSSALAGTENSTPSLEAMAKKCYGENYESYPTTTYSLTAEFSYNSIGAVTQETIPRSYFSGDGCYINVVPYLTWNPSYSSWFFSIYTVGSVYIYGTPDDVNWECPPCYTEVIGRCVYDNTLPGCTPTDVCQDAICVDIIGPENILCNNTYTYTASISSTNAECVGMVYDSDTIVYLSYNGSTIDNFIGPNTVTVPAGSTSVDFNVTIEDGADGILIISSNTSNGNECTSAISNVYCDYIPPDIIIDEPEIELPSYCCDYVPKNFIGWSYGDGMNQLVPPNER